MPTRTLALSSVYGTRIIIYMYRRVYVIIYRELFMPATRCFATRAAAATIDVGRIILYRYTYPAVSGIYLYGFMGSRRAPSSLSRLIEYTCTCSRRRATTTTAIQLENKLRRDLFFPPPPPPSPRGAASRTARRSILCVNVPLTARWLQWHHAHVVVW